MRFKARCGASPGTLVGVTLRSRWATAGAVYVLLVMALAAAFGVNGDAGFYGAAAAMTFPSCVILYPFLYSVVILVGMAVSGGINGSGPSWVAVPLYALAFGAAAVANVFLIWLVARSARPFLVRVRRLLSRA